MKWWSIVLLLLAHSVFAQAPTATPLACCQVWSADPTPAPLFCGVAPDGGCGNDPSFALIPNAVCDGARGACATNTPTPLPTQTPGGFDVQFIPNAVPTATNTVGPPATPNVNICCECGTFCFSENGLGCGQCAVTLNASCAVPGQGGVNCATFTPTGVQLTATPTLTRTTTPTSTATPTVTPTPTFYTCVGDCNGNGQTTVAECTLCLNIHVGNNPLSDCPACDSNGDGIVTTLDALLCQYGLTGCNTPSPTPTVTRTPTRTRTPTAVNTVTGTVPPTGTTTPVVTRTFTPTRTPSNTATPDNATCCGCSGPAVCAQASNGVCPVVCADGTPPIPVANALCVSGTCATPTPLVVYDVQFIPNIPPTATITPTPANTPTGTRSPTVTPTGVVGDCCEFAGAGCFILTVPAGCGSGIPIPGAACIGILCATFTPTIPTATATQTPTPTATPTFATSVDCCDCGMFCSDSPVNGCGACLTKLNSVCFPGNGVPGGACATKTFTPTVTPTVTHTPTAGATPTPADSACCKCQGGAGICNDPANGRCNMICPDGTPPAIIQQASCGDGQGGVQVGVCSTFTPTPTPTQTRAATQTAVHTGTTTPTATITPTRTRTAVPTATPTVMVCCDCGASCTYQPTLGLCGSCPAVLNAKCGSATQIGEIIVGGVCAVSTPTPTPLPAGTGCCACTHGEAAPDLCTVPLNGVCPFGCQLCATCSCE